MFHSILVPLDGSAFGEHALPLAAGIARRAGATLRVVHAHEPGDDRLLTWYTLDPGVEQSERAYLDSVARRLATGAGVTPTTALVHGSAAEALPEHARGVGADLIVMTTHGRGPLSRFWLGSVADRLVRLLPVPVLLVRPRESAPALDVEPALARMLIPLDGSDLAERILRPALALGGLMGTAYTLLRVIKPVPVLGDDLAGHAAAAADVPALRGRQGEAQTYLDRVAGRLRAGPWAVHTRVIAHPHAAAAILDEARAGPVDLIALATHGREGLQRLLLGSVADKVLRQATIPVLVQPPAEGARR
jgi:nucleotide-binding universal stress UspA family protein